MLKSKQDYPRLRLLGTILGQNSVGILLCFLLGRLNLIWRRRLPCQNPACFDDPLGIHCTPNLLIVEAFSNSLILQKAVHLLGFGSLEEFTVSGCQFGQLHLSTVHLLGEEEDRISFQCLPLTVCLHIEVKTDGEGFFSFLKS